MFNILLLISVSWWLLEGFADQGRDRRYHLSLGLSVLDGQLHFLVTNSFGNVITNFFS